MPESDEDDVVLVPESDEEDVVLVPDSDDDEDARPEPEPPATSQSSTNNHDKLEKSDEQNLPKNGNQEDHEDGKHQSQYGEVCEDDNEVQGTPPPSG